jgi:hypothetical protein
VGQDGALSHIFEGCAHIACKALKKRKAFLNMPRVFSSRSETAAMKPQCSLSLANIAQANRALGHFEEARYYVESSLRIIESLRANVVSKELRASYFATQQDQYGFYIELLMQLHKQVHTQILQTSPGYEALTQPQPLKLAEIQRQALDADTLLLEYSLGSKRSFFWALTSTSIRSYELPKRKEIEAAAQRVSEMLSKAPRVRRRTAEPREPRLKEAGGEYLTAAAGLSRTLLGPVADQLVKRRYCVNRECVACIYPVSVSPVRTSKEITLPPTATTSKIAPPSVSR